MAYLNLYTAFSPCFPPLPDTVRRSRSTSSCCYGAPARPSRVASRSRSHPARAITTLLAWASPHDSPVFVPLRSHPAITRSLPPHVAKSPRALPEPRPVCSAYYWRRQHLHRATTIASCPMPVILSVWFLEGGRGGYPINMRAKLSQFNRRPPLILMVCQTSSCFGQ